LGVVIQLVIERVRRRGPRVAALNSAGISTSVMR